MRNQPRGESGQAVAFFVGILVLIFGFMAFAIDIGFFFHARRVAQNAVDAGAFAGASELPGCGDQDPDPLALAYDYDVKNLAGKTFSAGDDIIPTPEYRTYDVDGTAFPTVYTKLARQQSFVFAKFFGLTSGKVPAEAEAACLPATGGGLCPFYIQSPDPANDPAEGYTGDAPFGIEKGRIYRFKFGSSGDAVQGGNRGFLSLYGQGGKDIRDAIENGCQGDDPDYTVEEGQVFSDTKPGNMASVWASIEELYSYEGTTVEGVSYPSHAACRINFDASQFSNDSPWDFSVAPTDDAATVAAKALACALDPDPANNIAGRFWPIALTDEVSSGGRTDVPFDHLAMMYIVCLPTVDCNDGLNPGQAALYGMFIDAVPVILPNLTGVSSNDLAPKRPLLVR